MKTELINAMKAACCSVLLSIQAFGQGVTLDSVLRAVDKRNPVLQEYDQRVNAQEAYTAGAKGWMAPMVGIGTFMTPYPGQTTSEANRGSLMLSVEQNIPNPAKLSANQKFFSSRSALETQGRAVRYNALRADAKTSYYQWIVAEQKLRILQESEDIVQMMLKLARIRYPYNQGSLGAIYKTEGRLHEVQNMSLMTRGEIEQAKFSLRTVMNLPAEMPLSIDTTVRLRFERNRLVADTAGLRARRSDIKQLEQSIQTMRLSQELQQAEARPDFRLRFDHMQPFGAGMPTQFTAMAMMSIPIAPWASRSYKAETKGMSYDIDAMKRGQDAILLEARGMLAGMAAQLERMEQQLDNYRLRIIPALRQNYQATMIAYEENRESLPMVVDSWEALNMARLEYTEKLAAYYDMIVRYEKEAER